MNFSTPTKLPDGRYFAKCNEKKLVQLNSVYMETSFAEGDTVTFTLDSSHQDKMKPFDLNVLELAKSNSTEWFGREVQEKSLQAAFTSSFKDGTMNILKSKNTTAWRKNADEKIDPNEIKAGSKCDIVLEMSGIWFMKKTFGIVWRVIQIRLPAPPKPPTNSVYLFEDDPEEDEVEEEEDYF